MAMRNGTWVYDDGQAVHDGRKLCPRCSTVKLLNDFSPANTTSGYRSECRECRRTGKELQGYPGWPTVKRVPGEGRPQAVPDEPVIAALESAVAAGIRLQDACRAVGMNPSTYQRWVISGEVSEAGSPARELYERVAVPARARGRASKRLDAETGEIVEP